MSVDYLKVRKAIESVEDKPQQMALKAIYLLAARPFEIMGEITSTDKIRHTKPMGLNYQRCWTAETDAPDLSSKEVAKLVKIAQSNRDEVEKILDELTRKIPVIVFQLKISKQASEKGQQPPFHLVAVPLEEKYEPWTEGLYDYVKDSKDREYVFEFNRQDLWEYVTRKKKAFQGMFYTIDGYTATRRDGQKKFATHARPLKFGALRIARALELREKYCLGVEDLSEYVGLQLDLHSFPLPKQPKKVYFDNWQMYIKKLCKSN